MIDPILEIHHLCVDYGPTRALDDVNLLVEHGEYLGILGPNGGGKTTLLRTILGFINPTSGSIKMCPGTGGQPHSLGYVAQSSTVDRSFPITVLEAVLTATLNGRLHPFGRYKKAEYDFAREQLKRVGIEDLETRQISALSGGQFQRVLIARALAANPTLLLLDEPTANVDPSSRTQIYELLARLNLEGMAIMLVTHDLLAINSEVNSIICLNCGIVYNGKPESTKEVIGHMYGVPVDAIDGNKVMN